MRKLTLALGAALLSTAAFAQTSPKHTFEVKSGNFQLDGKPVLLLGAEIHPARIPKEYWRHRIQMARAMGLNTISPYIFWNMLEPEKGKFNFRGESDIAEFVRICKEEGMWVLLRPGPYVCAEWEFGGYPYWLLSEPGLTVRANNEPFFTYTQRYLDKLAEQVGKYQVTKGGNILMVQVENEYGSYGSDKVFMKRSMDQLTKAGFNVPFYVAEGGSQLANAWIPGTVAGVNGGGGPDVKTTVDKYTPGGPYFVPEFYPGWLDHWGEKFIQTEGGTKSFKWLVENGVSVNLYMFHGGTNFGFYNGGNYGSKFEPDITSYDYDAPLDEAGRPTPKYYRFRSILEPLVGKLPPVPAVNPTITIPRFSLGRAGTLENYLGNPVRSAKVLSFENLGQDYGYVLYRHRFDQAAKGTLTVKDVRDYAIVRVNGRSLGTLDRRFKQSSLEVDIAAGETLEILVENGGRINYGDQIPINRKGITEAVLLNGETVSDWLMYRLPMRNPGAVRTDILDAPKLQGPAVFKGKFELTEVGDAYLDLRGWNKGAVWINGHNVGRYWNIGPQQTLYVPGPWLRKGTNEVAVFDLYGVERPSLEGLPAPILTDLRPDLDRKPTVRPRSAQLLSWSFGSSQPALEAELAPRDGEQKFTFEAKTSRFVGFESLSSHPGDDFGSLAELRLYDPSGKLIDRSKWRIALVDSEETEQEDGRAENILDGDDETIWHSVWSADHTKNPHRIIIDLGSSVSIGAVGLTPRVGNRPAKLKGFRIYTM